MPREMPRKARALFTALLAASLCGVLPAAADAAPSSDGDIRRTSRLEASSEPIAQIRDGYLILKGGATISLANLPSGENLVIDVVVDVDNPLPGGTTQLSSQVQTTGSNFTTEPSDDPATGADDDPTITNVEITADLQITKTDGAAQSIPGQPVTYTIVATNAGPSLVSDAAVTDSFPVGLSNCTYTSVAAGGATGNTGAGAGDIADMLSLPVAASVTYTATCDVAPDATGSIANTAMIESSTVMDPNNANNSATDTNGLVVTADLEITKTNGTTTSIPGIQTTYTIVASNQGPSTVTDAEVTDNFAASLSGCTYTSVAAGGATGNTVAGAGDIADTLSMPPGSSVTYTATCDIAPGATGNLSNTAQISSVIADETDAGDNSATDTDSLEVTADLEISKTNGTTTSIPGGQTTYTIVANNQGPSTVSDASVTDTFNAPLSACTYTSVAAGGASGNTAAGAGDIADTLSMPPGSSVTYTATCDIDADATGSLSNTAQISSVIAVETDAGDNSATDTDSLEVTADLEASKDDGVSSVLAGGSTTYTIIFTNQGPSTVTDAEVSDAFPSPELENCTYTSVAAGGASGNTAAGAGDIADTLDMPPTSSVTYTATCDVDADAIGTISNTAQISSEIATETDPGDNSATDTDDVGAAADLSLEKTASPTVIGAGDPVTYTISVSNAGPGDAVNVVVTDVLPAEVTLVSTSGCAEDPVGVPTCTLGTILASDSAQFTIDVTVNPAPPASFDNTASVTADNADPDPSNNSDTATLTTDGTPPQVVSVASDLGVFEDCDTLRGEVSRFEVVFSETMATSERLEGDGDETEGGAPEADVLANYWLVRPGEDRSFDTVACGVLAGDDFRVSPGGLTYEADTPAPPQARVTLEKPSQLSSFTDDLYRLIVCGNITDEGGNPLDGDGDGMADGSDDFSIDFRIDRFNRFENGHFDCDLGGWTVDPPGSLQVSHDAADYENSADSGSAQVAFAGDMSNASGFILSQCAEIDDASRLHRLSSRIRSDGALNVAAAVLQSCTFFDQPACGGGELGSEDLLKFVEDSGGGFSARLTPFEFDVPAATVSAFCSVKLSTSPNDEDEVFDAYADDLYFGVGDDPIFGSGFETGDFSRWDTVVGN